MVRPQVTSDDGIAVVVLTHNRAELLRKCVENVLLRTSEATREIVIWDNGSTDETQAYLATVRDPRVRVIRSETNVGHNGYARAFRETTSAYMVELDDDVVSAPPGWDAMLLDAFRKLPEVGFLAADIEDDPHDEASHWRHHIRAHEYTPVVHNGVNLLVGPTGGGCAMTSREANERAGGFIERDDEVFWLEDGVYIDALQQGGLRRGRARRPGGPSHGRLLLHDLLAGEGGVLEAPLGAQGQARRRQAGAGPSAVRAQAERPLRLVRRSLRPSCGSSSPLCAGPRTTPR